MKGMLAWTFLVFVLISSVLPVRAQDTAPGATPSEAQDKTNPLGSTRAAPDAGGPPASVESKTTGNPLTATADTSAPAASVEIVVFQLKAADPFAIEPTLRQIFVDELKIIAQRDGSGSKLIVRGPHQSIQQLKDLLKLIDRAAATGEEAMSPGGSTNFGAADRNGSEGVGSGRRRRTASQEELQRQFGAVELQAAELARKARQQGQTANQGTRADLTKVVAAAFAARQRLHEAELVQLELRLKRTREMLATRERIKDTIIDRRVDDLLNPEVRWNSSEAQPAQRSNYASGSTPAADDNTGRTYRETLRKRWELIKRGHEQGYVTLDELLKAAGDYYTAEAAAAKDRGQRRTVLQQRLEQLENVKSLIETLHRSGRASESDLLAAQAEVLKAQAELADEPSGGNSP